MTNSPSFNRGSWQIPRPEPEARAIRSKFKLSRPEFASLLGISVGTLRNWEQGVGRPEDAERVLLHVVDLHPDAVRDASLLRQTTRGRFRLAWPKRTSSAAV
jgi:DNA-binding XRE family transcriptional regulator